jgi:hypothetical protein
MQKLIPLILLSLAALTFSEPAAAPEKDKSKAGSGASTEGGASLGGTGIDSGVANPRGVDETDKRLRIERKPKKDPEDKPDRRSSAAKDASTGATNPRGSLSDEADKQDQEFSKNRRK